MVLLLDRAPDAEIVELTGSGILLWELLSSPVTAAEAAGELADLYGADAGEVLADIEPVLEHLVARGYATRVEAS